MVIARAPRTPARPFQQDRMPAGATSAWAEWTPAARAPRTEASTSRRKRDLAVLVAVLAAAAFISTPAVRYWSMARSRRTGTHTKQTATLQAPAGPCRSMLDRYT